MSSGKVCIKHFECACRNILSFDTVLLDNSINVDVSHCFIMDILVQVPPPPPPPHSKSARDFSVSSKYLWCKKTGTEKFSAVMVRQSTVVTL